MSFPIRVYKFTYHETTKPYVLNNHETKIINRKYILTCHSCLLATNNFHTKVQTNVI